MEAAECQRRLRQLGCIAILPTFNNAATLARVIDDALQFCADVMIVNDGSTDATHEILASRSDIVVVEYTKNRGKGHALKTGLRLAMELNFNYAITMDSDGQHFADDMPKFVEEIEQHPDSLIIGARNLQADGMPGKNTFANKFSNFWFKVETATTLVDTQSGYRLYPLRRMRRMRFFTPRYEFEVEVIVRCAWRGIRVSNVPIKVIYPEDRVSHFRPLKDFTRISILNTVLVTCALLYYYPKCFIQWLLRPKKVKAFFDNYLFHSGESVMQLALAAGFGVFMGIIPIWGFQMIVAVALAHFLRLNKIIVLAFSNISIPPILPFILLGSLWFGSLIVGGSVLPDIETLTIDVAFQSLTQYLCGSVILAFAAGATTTAASALIIACVRKIKSR